LSQPNAKIEEIIKSSLGPFLKQVKEDGIKLSIEKMLPGFSVDDFLISKIKHSLKLGKKINLGKFGFADIYYRNALIFEPVGLVRLFIKNIYVSNKKILTGLNNCLHQIEQNFLQNEDYIWKKINGVISDLNKISVYKNGSPEDKTFYDLILAILSEHYKYSGSEFPKWFKTDKIGKKEFAGDCLGFISENLFKAFEKIIENVYFDYNVTFDSAVLKFFLNKRTNSGQVSGLFDLFGFNPRLSVENFIKNYTGESFLNGLGEMIFAVVDTIVCGVSPKTVKNNENYFNFTNVFGKDRLSRRFRWFGDKSREEFIEISEDESFEKCIMIRAKKEPVILARPTILNFGALTKYEIENKILYSAEVENLQEDKKYYFKIKRLRRNYAGNFKTCKKSKSINFLVFADSQGMIESDYEVFKDVMSKSIKMILKSSKKRPPDFLVHVGDFVDDGNNENYWDFILDSENWGSFPVFAVAGNHEAKFNPSIDFAGVKNSIFTHFNLDLDCPQEEKGAYYSFECKDALFMVLNTNVQYGLGKRQMLWAEKVLKNSAAKWKIIFTHKSAYSNGPHCNDPDVRFIASDIAKLAAFGGVCMVIGGHDHVYSRSEPACLGKNTSEEEEKNVFSDPDGTIFVTMGTSGVKNYKVSRNPPRKNKLVLDLRMPMFSNVKIYDNTLEFSAYKCEHEKTEIVDKFFIKKNNKSEINRCFVERKIENLPDCPYLSFDDRIHKTIALYNKLSDSEKKNVRNFDKLKKICKSNRTFNDILKSDVAIVCDKGEFLKALKRKNIGVIIINCNEIKFENKLGFKRKIKIERNLFIRGDAKLSLVSFSVKKGITFILGGLIRINNNRRIFSLFPSARAFELQKNSVLVLLEDVNVEQAFGIGPRRAVKAAGGARVYLAGNKEFPPEFIKKDSAEVILDAI
jgi:hypothetical protein